MYKAEYQTRGPVPHNVIDAVEFEQPALESNQVLVEVLAAPINPSDVLTLTGEYGMLPPLPAVGGNEGVGKIVQLGDQSSPLKIGQQVLLPVGIGTWATHVVAEVKTLVPLPNDADAKQLSMITVNPPTASLMLSEFVELQAGDWVIQNAANSGVGTYLIQLAKLKGLKTVNVVRRESAVQGVLDAGGDIVVVDGSDLAKRVKQQTEGATIKLAIDAVAGSSTGRLADCLSNGATLVNYGAMSGEPSSITAKSLVFNDITVKGFWLAKWFRNATKQEQMALYGELTQLIASGKLHTKIHQTFPVENIKQAVKAASQGERNGKILIAPES
jgi:NADPH:quinone reductase-like Zn-dependent oxidoreductase